MTVPPQLEQDVEALRATGLEVDIIDEHPRYFVVMRDLALPAPYEPRVSDVMVIADYQYPQSALDMFWTDPHVRIGDHYPQGAEQYEQYCGRTWQRWSWHYPWNPAAHNLQSHLEVWFERLARAA